MAAKTIREKTWPLNFPIVKVSSLSIGTIFENNEDDAYALETVTARNRAVFNFNPRDMTLPGSDGNHSKEVFRSLETKMENWRQRVGLFPFVNYHPTKCQVLQGTWTFKDFGFSELPVNANDARGGVWVLRGTVHKITLKDVTRINTQ